jgi:hypothetical protein
MMKLIFLFLLLPILVFSQEKRDYIWILGYDAHSGTTGGEGALMDFTNDEIAINFLNKEMNIARNNGIGCDKNGNLQFYTNGCFIANNTHQLMENGNDLNPGSIHDGYCNHGYLGQQGTLVLPDPISDNVYYIIHNRLQFSSDLFGAYSDVLFKSKIDMGLNNGEGKVIEKNIPILEDTLWPGYLTATKDINGIDWWIIAAENLTNQYYKIKLSESGIEVIDKQAIGDTLAYYVGQGQAVFSPDGSKYFFYDQLIGLKMFDFDRATGHLSNFQKLNVADTLYFGGVAVSPNSRFLYVSNALYLYQFDLQAADIQASQVTVDTFDGFNSPFPANFFLMQLGPDCRIYMSTGNGTDRLHVIEYPNLKGKDCGFQQHAIELPSYNASTIPNFPNYRLGTPYPVCDSSIALVTTAVQVPPPQQGARLWPNPASGEVHLALPAALPQPGTWALYNGMGQRVRQEVLATGQAEHSLSVAGLPPGLYFWEVESSNQRLGGGKLVLVE